MRSVRSARSAVFPAASAASMTVSATSAVLATAAEAVKGFGLAASTASGDSSGDSFSVASGDGIGFGCPLRSHKPNIEGNDSPLYNLALSNGSGIFEDKMLKVSFVI